MALKKLVLAASAVCAATTPVSDSYHNTYLMRYNQPGTVGYTYQQYPNALPIGNGRLGAGIYGQPANEALTINEDSIWSGPEQDRLNPNGLSSLPELRSALLANNVTEAANICYANFTSNPTTSREYSFLADIALTFPHSTYTKYSRVLDVQNAVVSNQYTSGGVQYNRQWIASFPAKAILGSFNASKPGSLSFTAQWNRTGLDDRSRVGNMSTVGKNAVVLRGGQPEGAPYYVGMFAIYTKGGQVTASNGTVTVKGADSALIVVSAETDYWNPGSSSTKLQKLVQSNINQAAKLPFATLMSQHTADFRSYFDKTQLTLYSSSTNYASTIPQRYSAYQSGNNDYALEALLFAFGRYLMISSSRDGSLPPNLIGIWNNQDNPGWGGKFTTDLNVEMNHWLTETTGLSDMSYQLFNFTKHRVVPNGERTAKVLYGCSGWCSHHNNDVWGDTAPHDEGTEYTYWPMGGAWPMTHLYEHYRFTGDKEFLKTTALPILTGLVEFYNDFLIERDGYLVTAPSASTENSYITPWGVTEAIASGTTSDSYYLIEIFTNFLNASSIVGSNHLVKEAEHILSKIRTPFEPSYYGGFRQWWDDWQEAGQNQPMMDSLLGLYPFASLSTWDPVRNHTQVALNTLNHFLDETAGNSWSVVWPIAYWARLYNGNQAYSWIQNTLQNFISSSGATWAMNVGYYQIDGNLGFVAGVVEMLLQSQGPADIWPLVLLPALPSNWAQGSVQGLGARGGFTVDINWSKNFLTSATIVSNLGSQLNVSVPALPSNSGFMIKENGMKAGPGGHIVFQSTQGSTYTVVPVKG